ncbi:MAG: hypothetical protein JW864_05255 [Spirochaetes bacterium]|nr:hypothetical protein [Spirochaetota bacterium]
MKNIIVYDTTLRDGEQAPGFSMNPDQKYKMCEALIESGVDVIEAGFPASSPGEFEAVKLISALKGNSVISAFARAVPEDINKAAEALSIREKRRINIIMSTSDIHLQYQLKISREEAVEKSVTAVNFARELFDDVQFSAMDATRSDIDYLCDVLSAVRNAGASTLNIADTTGYAIPGEIYRIIKTIQYKLQITKGTKLSIHCHNDLGMALANTISAIEAGVDQVECTVTGIGERAGNTSMGNLIDVLQIKKDRFDVSIVTDPEKYKRAASQLLNQYN